ncbi:MAG: HAMP domain-containing sensor histidine kinase [Anaerolineae bacterium]
MIHSLRAKLALSHILPILLLIPLLSLYLLYTLEDFYSQNLLQQLTYQAQLLQNRAQTDATVVQDGAAAQQFLDGVKGLTDARVLLLSKEGVILGSTRPEDAVRIGMQMTGPPITQALSGAPARGIGQGFVAEVAYVVLPLTYRGALLGALRISYEITDVRAQFSHLQWLVLGGVAATAILALALSFALTTTITRPLQQLTESAQRIAAGNYQTRVPARGRDEVGVLAASFNEMARRLEEMERARERQLAAITHELARPLTGMRAAVETLYEGADRDRELRDSLLGGVLEELTRLGRLIETLQAVQKRIFHPLELHLAPVSLERVIHASMASYESLAAQRGITLTQRLPRHPLIVQADEDRLIQVLTNLLDNACKFTPSGGGISVEAGGDSQSVWVRVVDTGEGIAPEELPLLFQEFYHGGPAQPPEKHGMGLGLAICRAIVRAHGGAIWAESQPGVETRVTLTIPRTVPSPAPPGLLRAHLAGHPNP